MCQQLYRCVCEVSDVVCKTGFSSVVCVPCCYSVDESVLPRSPPPFISVLVRLK